MSFMKNVKHIFLLNYFIKKNRNRCCPFVKFYQFCYICIQFSPRYSEFCQRRRVEYTPCLPLCPSFSSSLYTQRWIFYYLFEINVFLLQSFKKKRFQGKSSLYHLYLLHFQKHIETNALYVHLTFCRRKI